MLLPAQSSVEDDSGKSLPMPFDVVSRLVSRPRHFFPAGRGHRHRRGRVRHPRCHMPIGSTTRCAGPRSSPGQKESGMTGLAAALENASAAPGLGGFLAWSEAVPLARPTAETAGREEGLPLGEI